MSTYRYLSTNLITGALQADWIPLDVSSMSRVINGAGSLSAQYTPVVTEPPGSPISATVLNAAYLNAIEPRRSVLWAFQDNVPIWNGIIWDQTPQSVLGDAPIPIVASTMDSLLSHRVISSDLTFTNTDIFDIVRSLVLYAVTKSPSAAVAGLVFPTTEAGIPLTIAYSGAELQKVSDALDGLINITGMEYTFAPGLDSSGNLITNLLLGYPLGLTADVSRLAYNMPGNLIDYQFPRVGNSSANRLYASAQGTQVDANGNTIPWVSALPHGEAADDLGAGYPLLEDSVTYGGSIAITSQAMINSFADGAVQARKGAQDAPLLVLGADRVPRVNQVNLGDECQFALTSQQHPARTDGSPGIQNTGRIVSWALTPPNGTQQVEQTAIQLGALQEL